MSCQILSTKIPTSLKANGLRPRFSGNEGKDPEGLHVLWNAVLQAGDDVVADAAGEFLLKICTAAMKKENDVHNSLHSLNGEKVKGNSSADAFLSKVFGRLKTKPVPGCIQK